MKDRFKSLLRQEGVSKHWGSVKLSIGQVGIYLTMLSLVMISLTLWQTGWLQHTLGLTNFWLFVLIIVGIILLLLIFAWRIDMPSFFKAWSDQFYKHDNPMRKDIQKILSGQKKDRGVQAKILVRLKALEKEQNGNHSKNETDKPDNS